MSRTSCLASILSDVMLKSRLGYEMKIHQQKITKKNIKDEQCPIVVSEKDSINEQGT